METFKCNRCLRVFTRNYILQKHLRRKVPCKINLVKIENDELRSGNTMVTPTNIFSNKVTHGDPPISRLSRQFTEDYPLNSRISRRFTDLQNFPVDLPNFPEISRITQGFTDLPFHTTRDLPNNLNTPERIFENYPENSRISRKFTEVPVDLPNNPVNLPNNPVNLPNNSNPINLSKNESTTTDYVCDQCGKTFKHKNSYYRHRKHYCYEINVPNGQSSDLSSELSNLKKRIKELEEMQSTHTNVLVQLKDKPHINQNILQVVCVGNNDNYLDMLTERLGDFDQALDYIKDCALSNLTGDCKLIRKIYFHEGGETPIRYLDRGRQKIGYLDENHQKVIDHKGVQLGKRLANNLQNSYLKGVNHLIKDTHTKKKLIDDYDVQSWNAHIYELSDTKYQKKLVSQLDIPNAHNEN